MAFCIDIQSLLQMIQESYGLILPSGKYVTDLTDPVAFCNKIHFQVGH
jgi:hypothetical protein